MRTIEEVREHLESTGYKSEDMNKIFSFLQKRYPKEALKIQSKDLNYGSFLEWYFEEEEVDEIEEEKTLDIELLIDAIIKDAESNGIKVSRFTIEEDAEELEEKLKEMNNKSKMERDKALAELDKAEKELEEKIEEISDPKLQKMAKSFLGFAKELKEKAKKEMNA